MSARFSADDYAAAARALLPRGRVWSDDPGSVQGQALGAIGKTFERSDQEAGALIADALPATTDHLLPEWEGALGLPDPCAGPSPTLEQRKAQVLARFIAGGGQSRARFIAYAAALGVTITIRTYAPFRAGLDVIGAPLYGPAWAHAWGITILANATGVAREVIACELDAIKPAETVVLFLN